MDSLIKEYWMIRWNLFVLKRMGYARVSIPGFVFVWDMRRFMRL